MLVIEGPDMVGKTTLANEIENQINKIAAPFSLRRLHYRMLKPDFDYHFDYLLDIRKWTICDRFVWSELAYGEACRSSHKIEPYALDEILDKLDEVQGMCIFILPTYKAYMDMLTANQLLVHGLEDESQFDEAARKRHVHSGEDMAVANTMFWEMWTHTLVGIIWRGVNVRPIDVVWCMQDADDFPDQKFAKKVAKEYVKRQREII